MKSSHFIVGLELLVSPLVFLMLSPTPAQGMDRNKVSAQANALHDSRGTLTINGVLDEKAWRSALNIAGVPAEAGVPTETAGKVMLMTRYGYLCIAAFCPEPGGKVVARSIGRNPIWEKDAVTSPEVEDRIVFKLKTGEDSATIDIAINPWGAWRIERDGKPVPSSHIMATANITKKGWSVECAVPLNELNSGQKTDYIGFRATRIRSRRPLDPEFRWNFPGTLENDWYGITTRASSQKDGQPDYKPFLPGNSDPPLMVGYVPKVPSTEIVPDDLFWQGIEGFRLRVNDQLAGMPKFATEVKWVHDGASMALFFRCEEDTRLNCNTGARDGNIASDDHVSIYLSTSGSSFIEIQINPVGIVRDALGRGPHMYRTSSSAWNGNIETDYHINQDAWFVRANIPLDEIASALGENSVPAQWRVLVGRSRQPRRGEIGELSTIPVIGNPFLPAPARHRRLELTRQAPAQIVAQQEAATPPAADMLAENLAILDADVFSRLERKVLNLPLMLDHYLTGRVEKLALKEIKQWEQVETLQEWEQFRRQRVESLKNSLGPFPAEKSPLDYQVSSSWHGEGFQVQNIAFQSRPGFYVAANLYLPEQPQDNMPAIVIIPSHHYPKIQGELKDCGIVWARSGCAVLILDSPGFGERTEVAPWYRQPYHSESQLELQLNLVGQNRLGWVAWDVMRSVDALLALGNVDPERLILIGSVTWGGGRPASIAGLLDERFDAVIPFNWGRVYWDSYGVRRSVIDQISPWIICAAIAPRKFVYAHEFSWEGEEGNPLPAIFAPAWPRFNKVYGFYGAEENLGSSQGKGVLRVKESMGDCYSLGSVQRKPLYHILNDWFDIPLPSEQDMQIDIDSWLTFGGIRTGLDVVRHKESQRRMPDSALLSISPETDARIERKALHELAMEMADEQLGEVRRQREGLGQAGKKAALAGALAKVIGNIEPAEKISVDYKWLKSLSGADIEAFVVHPDSGIMVPVLLIKPVTKAPSGYPLVLALAEEGKQGFLSFKSEELARLIERGIAVCLPDLRGSGETAASRYNRGSGLADRAMDLGESMLGMRLRDVRAILNCLRHREDIDSRRIVLWGESFTPVNEQPIWVDELTRGPVGPQIQHSASPMGAHLALLAATFEPEIRAVAVNGGLSSYRSLLESNVTYVPYDIVIPQIFAAGDIADICAGLAPMPLLISGCVDGRNSPVDPEHLIKTMAPVAEAYREAGSGQELSIDSKVTPAADLVSWICAKLEEPR